MTKKELLLAVHSFLNGATTRDELQRVVGLVNAAYANRKDQNSEGVPLWLVPIRDRLGKEPDLKLAEETRRSNTSISNWRRKLGIAAPPKSVLSPWVIAVRDRLGTVPDKDLAKETGADTYRVAALRRSLSIAAPLRAAHKPYVPPSWVNAILPRLGRVPDVDIAREVGRSKQRIHQIREHLGIALTPEAVETSRGSPRRSRRKPLPKEVVALLGVESDCELSRRFHVPAPRLQAERRLLGLPPAESKPSKLVEYWDLLGVVPDTEIATRVGCSAHTVAMYRNKNGISSLPRNKKSKRGAE